MNQQDLTNVNVDPDLTRLQYGSGVGEPINIPAVPGSVAITVINGETGPTITFTSNLSGVSFTPAGGGVVTLDGTLAIANGGTGATTVAGILTALELSKNVSRVTDPTAADDSTAGFSVNSLWANTATVKSFICQDATATAAVWTQIAP